MNEIRFFVGIDQTGAINSKGIPKPLPICILDQKNQSIQFHRIPRLGWQELEVLLKKGTKKSEVFLLIDSVMGLPKQANLKKRSILELISMTSKFEFRRKSYGMMTAHHFFKQFVKDLNTFPTRKVEDLTNANSIFKLHPFQKNISCGTFRIWKDLSRDPSWFKIWPHQTADRNRVYLAEGYPSYYWKTIFNLKTRTPENLLKKLSSKWVKKLHKQNVLEDADSIDAFVLAWSAQHLIQKGGLLQFPQDSIEGWIFGAGE